VALWFLTVNPAFAAIIHYARDSAGRLTAVTYTNGNAHTFTYDPAGNLLQRAHIAPGSGGGSPDSDGDGLLDAWELQYFGTLLRDGTGDFDTDGMSDQAEFHAGTIPNDPNSLLKLLPNPTIAGGGVTVQWQSIPGKTYRLQFKNSLSDADWTNVPGDVPATGAVSTKTDATATGQSNRFYRVLLIN
jgi:YD repeat-containing protein